MDATFFVLVNTCFWKTLTVSVTGTPRSGEFPEFLNMTLKARSAETSTVVGLETVSVFDWPLETAAVLNSSLPWMPLTLPLPPVFVERRPP